MILQEKIQKKAERFGKLAPAFLEGAEFALENQWININEDLPCNHKELLVNNTLTKSVIIKNSDGSIEFSLMYLDVFYAIILLLSIFLLSIIIIKII